MFNEEMKHGIVSHMNEDHSDAVELYLRAFAGVEGATNIQLSSIDAEGMDISGDHEGESMMFRVAFDPPLADAGEARSRLIKMVKTARQQLGS